MKIVADENMPLVREFFSGLGEVVTLPGRQMAAGDLQDADVLLVRSVTRVDSALLAGSRVRFVGTATIGTDHLDLGWLSAQGIAVASAPGCNALAVAEYVVAALVALGDLWQSGATLGVVGLGNVGTQVARLACALGFRVLGCDPFLSEASVPLVSLPELLEQADILCLHTPLIKEGPYPTRHLLDREALLRMKPGAVLISAGRGAVVDNEALLDRLQEAPGARNAVLDVWEGEPQIMADLLDRVRIGSPHIAGYSLDGKWRGTEQVYRALCRFLGRPADLQYGHFVEPRQGQPLEIPPDVPVAEAVRRAVQGAYPIGRDDAALRGSMTSPQPALAFDELRKHYWARREFPAHTVRLVAGHLAGPVLSGLGFAVAFE